MKTLFKQEEFENTAIFLRLGLPSPLNRHENAVNFKLEDQEFQNAGLLLSVDGKHFEKTELLENDDIAISLPEFS